MRPRRTLAVLALLALVLLCRPARAAEALSPAERLEQGAGDLFLALSGGAQTREVQRMLLLLGYDVGEIDGASGPSTNRAIADYGGDAPFQDNYIHATVKARLEADYAAMSAQLADWAQKYLPHVLEGGESAEQVWVSVCAYLNHLGYDGANTTEMARIPSDVYDAFGRGMGNTSADMRIQGEAFWHELAVCRAAEEQLTLLVGGLAERRLRNWAGYHDEAPVMTRALIAEINEAYVLKREHLDAQLRVLRVSSAAQFARAYGGTVTDEGFTRELARRVDQSVERLRLMWLIADDALATDAVGTYGRFAAGLTDAELDALLAERMIERAAVLSGELRRVKGARYEQVADFQRAMELPETGLWDYDTFLALRSLELKRTYLLLPLFLDAPPQHWAWTGAWALAAFLSLLAGAAGLHRFMLVRWRGAHVQAAVLSDRGKIRGNNEDSFYLNGRLTPPSEQDTGGFKHVEADEPLQAYAVCDGMGGEQAGEEASLYAVQALRRALRSQRRGRFRPEEMARLLQRISSEIRHQALARDIRSGTTIAMLLVSGRQAYTLHSGDSRVYLMRRGQLKRLTADHSPVASLVDAGALTEEQARVHPDRHRIMRYLGMDDNGAAEPVAVSEPIALRRGDRFLICSDGLTDMVTDADIAQLLRGAHGVDEAVHRLAGAALRHGGRDNVTVLCARVLRDRRGVLTAARGALSVLSLFSAAVGCVALSEWIYRLALQ